MIEIMNLCGDQFFFIHFSFLFKPRLSVYLLLNNDLDGLVFGWLLKTSSISNIIDTSTLLIDIEIDITFNIRS